ncbi:hypothetical protein HYN48_14130 [Flavobacterium magnum]|uniref:Uncharacterized protein n=1 Tax=Flavobacterium magnum TaxID=2162713 RepID=A0A2S0RIU7_9FLAO|nr:hypothetical protein [Flavobacterium magnum]AWA31138.1 hypothetical protein HYN48_14130 [Flavobacterium magnum]
MKKLSIILCILISISFGKPQNQDFKLEITKIDSRKFDNIKVTLKLKNNSSRDIEYFNMSCSYDILYVTDNPEVEIIGKECDKNIAVIRKIASKNSVKMKINLKCKNLKKNSFKIGFELTELPEKIQMRSDHSAIFTPTIIWTDKINL